VNQAPNQARLETWLWLVQRTSAAVLAVAVVVHLAGIIMAVQGGLSAAEIAARVGGNWAWAAFYGVFVVAAALHAPIGIRTVLSEMTTLPAPPVNLIAGLFAVLLLVMGFSAVGAVYGMKS
jgi:fumarate reductase subunit C